MAIRLDSRYRTADPEAASSPLQTSQSTSIARPILWVAIVALIAASLGSQLRITKCLGECTSVASSCCTPKTPLVDEACCGCCTDDEAVDTEHVRPTDSVAGFPADHDPGATVGNCPSDCCITIAFDSELAPINMQVNMPDMFSMAFLPFAQTCLPMPARVVMRPRLFDRGPPRVDKCTAMRACTLLLI